MLSLTGLILAAGKGKRMQSELPKVLHPIAGTPMLEWVVKSLKDIPCDSICLILNTNTKPFQNLLDHHPDLVVCTQETANGTAGAVASAQSYFEGTANIPYASGSLWKGKRVRSQFVLICAGDTPALDASILRKFVSDCKIHSTKLGILGMRVPNPTGYGRMIFSKEGRLQSIIEEKDADDQIKKIQICNSGIIFANVDYLFEILKKITNQNRQNEYYLTDCIRIAAERGDSIFTSITDQWKNFQGVNDKDQLASLESWFHHKN